MDKLDAIHELALEWDLMGRQGDDDVGELYTDMSAELLAILESPEEPGLSDDAIAQKIIDLVGPLCDRGTFEAPDWAIAVAHAVIYRNDPNARLARTPKEQTP